MAETIQKAQNIQDGAGPSKPPPTAEIHKSNEYGTTIEVCSRPAFGLDDLDMTEVNQPTQ